MKHTPGPWFYDHRDNQALIVDGQGFTVVELSTLENSTAQSALADNARLIAAAPDLLMALENLLKVVGVRIDDPRIEQFDAARAAINKAIGE